MVLTDEQYDVADRIVIWFESHPGLHNRSSIARAVKADYDDAYAALAFMDEYRMVAASGNGAWRKYGRR